MQVTSIIRGSVRNGVRRTPEVTEDEELHRRPVAPEDEVRVRARSGLPKVVRAPDLECFVHLLGPPRACVSVQIQASVLAEARSAARLSRRSLDLVVEDALSTHLRAMGLLRGATSGVYTIRDHDRLEVVDE